MYQNVLEIYIYSDFSWQSGLWRPHTFNMTNSVRWHHSMVSFMCGVRL